MYGNVQSCSGLMYLHPQYTIPRNTKGAIGAHLRTVNDDSKRQSSRKFSIQPTLATRRTISTNNALINSRKGKRWSMSATVLEADLDEIDYIISETASDRSITESFIACLYTGARHPSYCEPMPRIPNPELGWQLDGKLKSRLKAAVEINWSIHDGSLMIGRATPSEAYVATGWSYRLFPPGVQSTQEVNRGSAYHSCLAMSAQTSVDRVYYGSNGIIWKFVSGKSFRFE